MRVAPPLPPALAAFALVACATGTAQRGPGQWTGSFREPKMAATSVIGAPAPARSAGFGNIVVTPVGDAVGRTRVELTISAPGAVGRQLAWAVFSGSCGAATPPVLAVTEFPAIEIAASGAGSVRIELPMALDHRRSYHANVYDAGRATDVDNVMMCANLKFGGGR
jgi:hypothetical protein